MTFWQPDLLFSRNKFKELFPLEKGKVIIAGGKRPGQTAGMARYTVIAGKNGREHIIELGYGTVPGRARKPKDYPLLLPKLDEQLGRFNIDGNTHNILILRFLEKNGHLALRRFRNFNAPCEIETSLIDQSEKHIPGDDLALAVLEIAHARIHEILDGKINTGQPPQACINLIYHAIENKVGHSLKQAVN